ncbi:MAG: tetratricopeptide repeat protein [Planctomycetota bacterium]
MPRWTRALGPLLALPLFACGDDGAPPSPSDLPAPPDTSRLAELVDDISRAEIVRADAALSRDPGSVAAWSALGNAYEAAHLETRAEECYRAAAALEPAEPRHHYRSAITAQRTGEIDRALRALERTVELDPDYGPAWRRLALWRVDTGDVDGARAAVARAAPLLRGVTDAHVVRVRVELLADDAERAVEAAREAFRIDADDPYVRLVLGEALRRAGRSDEAAPHLAAGQNSTPRFTDPWSVDVARLRNRDADLATEGTRLEKEGRFAEALAAFEKVLARRPDDSNMLHRKGAALLGLGRNEDALEHLEAAHRTLPGDYDIALTRVRALRALNRMDDALTAADAIAARWPDNVQGLVVVGQLRADAGRLEPALETLRRATRLDPRDTRARIVLGRLLAQNRRFAEAVEVLEAGLESAPQAPPLAYYKLLLAAQSYAGLPETRIQATYARAVDAHGDAAQSLLQKR